MSERECGHVLSLRATLKNLGLEVYSEHGEPNGWVNVHCTQCHRTWEVDLREPAQAGGQDT